MSQFKHFLILLLYIFTIGCTTESERRQQFYSQLDQPTSKAFQLCLASFDSFLDNNFEGKDKVEKVRRLLEEMDDMESGKAGWPEWEIDSAVLLQLPALVNLEDTIVFNNPSSPVIRGMLNCCSDELIIQGFIDAHIVAGVWRVSSSVIIDGLKESLNKEPSYDLGLKLILIWRFYIPYIINKPK